MKNKPLPIINKRTSKYIKQCIDKCNFRDIWKQLKNDNDFDIDLCDTMSDEYSSII